MFLEELSQDMNGDGDVIDIGEMNNMTRVETSLIFNMYAKEIRKSFLEFFIKKNHKFIRSFVQ